MHSRPSPLTENDCEAADGDANDDVDVLDLEVRRSIDVIPEVTSVSPVSGSPVTGSSERAETHSPRPLLKDTTSHHATTSV